MTTNDDHFFQFLRDCEEIVGKKYPTFYELGELANALEIHGQFGCAQAMRQWYTVFLKHVDNEYGEINAANAQA